MKFLKRIGDAFHSRAGAYVFYALSTAAFVFFACASHNYAWMAETYPGGKDFMLVFLGVEAACAAILCVFMFLYKKIKHPAVRIIHTLISIFGTVLFIYSAVLLFGLDKGFVAEEMKRGLPKLTVYLPHLIFALALPLIFWGVGALLKNKKNSLKITALSATAVVLALAVTGVWYGGTIKQTPAFPAKELPVLASTGEKTETTDEFTLPMLGENSKELLKNPDRGLRMETYITLSPDGSPEGYPGSAEDPYEKFENYVEKYNEENPTVVQLYVYLTRYSDKPLDGTAFEQLEKMLGLLKEHNVRALLRFAYQNESNPDPEWYRVKAHLKQLSEWFKNNGQLVDDTIFAVQAGIVGYWGEGHNNFNFKNIYVDDAFNTLFRVVPEDMFIQTRTVDLRKKVSDKYSGRHGMHDDYLIGELNGSWSYWNGRSEEADRLADFFKNTINDGEMPWGVATYYDMPDGHPMDSMDALPILAQLKQYSMTTLSLEHNYREGGPETLYSMARWKEQSLTKQQLIDNGLPFHPAFLNEKGEINTFSYIQYHLGYLLSITDFEIDKKENKARFTIQNNGFAAPLNFDALTLVIDGEEYLVKSYDKYALGSMQAVTYTVDLPESFDGSQSVGVKISRKAGSDVSARFVNDTQFINGAQIMYS